MHRVRLSFFASLIALSASACTTVSTLSPHALSGVVARGPRGQAITLADVQGTKVKITPKSKVRLRAGKSASPWVGACSLEVNRQSVKAAGKVHDWQQLDAIQVKNPDAGKTFAAIVGAMIAVAAVVGTVAAVSKKSKGKKRRVKSRSKRRGRRHARVRARAPSAPRSSVRRRASAASAVKMGTARPRPARATRVTRTTRPSRRHRRYAALGHARRHHRHGVGVAVDIPLYVDDGIPPPPAPICESGLPCAAPPPPPQVAQAAGMESEAPTPPPPPPLHPLFSRRLCK